MTIVRDYGLMRHCADDFSLETNHALEGSACFLANPLVIKTFPTFRVGSEKLLGWS